MIVLNLEVICGFRTFKQFMLNLFDNNILAVEHDKNITCSKVNCACPTLDRRIERMHRRAGDLFTVHLYMNPFLGLIPEGLNNFFKCSLAGFFIGCPYKVAGLNVLNRYKPGFGCHQRSRYEALNHTKFLSDKLHSARHNAAGDADNQRIGYRRIPAVGNLLGCRIGCGTDGALNKTNQRRSRTRY